MRKDSPEIRGFSVVPSQLHEDVEELTFMPDATAADWVEVFRYSEEYSFEPGDEVISAGEPDRALYFLVNGTLQLSVPGATAPLKTIEAPSVLGEVAFLDGGPRSATLVAATPGELMRLGMDGYERLTQAEPDLARRMLFDLGRILAARLRMASDALARRGE